MPNRIEWTDKAQAISSMVGTATVLLAAIFGYLELREFNRARTARTTTEIQEKWDSPRFQESRAVVNGWIDSVGADGQEQMPREIRRSMDVVVNYFERVGHLLEQGAIDREDADAMISPLVVRYWCAYSPYIERLRERHDSPEMAEAFERWAARTQERMPDLGC